jgi:hypothetical protein
MKVKIYKTLILPVALYGSLMLTEEHTLRVFENRVLRRFGPKRDEVKGEWRKLHSVELHNLYHPQVSLGRMRWAGHVARMGEERKMYKILAVKPKGKAPLGRPRRRWQDGIRMDLRGDWLGVWIGFDWLRIGTKCGLL